MNAEDFVVRLEKIIRYYDLSASAFADKVKVQRSSISHLLSGRNRPSLEFVLKVIKSFPDVNLYWLLNGQGSFPPTTSQQSKIVDPTPIASVRKEANTPKSDKEKSIESIIIFYNDGSFKSYHE